MGNIFRSSLIANRYPAILGFAGLSSFGHIDVKGSKSFRYSPRCDVPIPALGLFMLWLLRRRPDGEFSGLASGPRGTG